ncbi:hypothetical protein AAII07_53645 [Microvirga sp. 0TCS3.31]
MNGYRPHSYIPNTARMLNIGDVATSDHLGFSISNSVAVIKVPDEVHSALMDDCLEWASGSDRPLFSGAVTQWIACLNGEEDVKLHQFREVSPGYITTTEDTEGKFIGLHLDNWDGRELLARGAARNRLCINIGPSARHLLIVPYTVRRVLQTNAPSIELAHSQFKDWLFGFQPSIPVFWVRIDPGYAYIAPTENVVHDGSSWGQMDCSIVLTALGRFKPPLW